MNAAFDLTGICTDLFPRGKRPNLCSVPPRTAISTRNGQHVPAECHRIHTERALRQSLDHRTRGSIPYRDFALIIGQGKPGPVGTDSNGNQGKIPKRFVIGCFHGLAAFQIPNAQTIIISRHDHACSVQGITDLGYAPCLRIQRLQFPRRVRERCDPAHHLPSLPRNGQLVPHRIIGQRFDHILVALQYIGHSTRAQIENANVTERPLGIQMFSEKTCDCHVLRVRRQRHRIHQPLVPRTDLATQNGGTFAGLPIPDTNGFIIGGGDYHLSIGTDVNVTYRGAMTTGIQI